MEAPTPETKNTLEERRRDMLTQAKKCFNEALHKPDNDEPWLQHYMLGKIAEKMCRPPGEYLESYLKVYIENVYYLKSGMRKSIECCCDFLGFGRVR